jgi:drug/metabolite transporter (DMT)-like permease
MRLTHKRAVWLMVLATFLWALAGLVTRHLESAQKFEVTFWRSFFTFVSLLLILPLTQGRDVFVRMRHAGPSLWAAGVCWSGMFTFFMLALMLTSVANVLITMALAPLFTALAARFVINYRLPLRTWGAIAVAGAGMVYMFGHQLGSGISVAGTLVALCIPVAAAANWTVSQHAHAQGSKIDMVPAVLIGAGISALVTLPFALPFQATILDLSLLAGLGLVQLAIPCTLAVLCTQVLKAPEVALLSLLEVIFGILLVWLGAGEAPESQVLTGGVMVMGALLFNELLAWRERS